MGHKMAKPEIRTVRSADVVAVEQLLKSVPGHWQSCWREDVVSAAVAAAGELAFVALEQGRVVGFCCGHDVGFRGYVSELAVAPDRHGHGIGSALIRHLESVLRARGCAVLVADVYPPAADFYRRLGWVEPEAMLLAARLSNAG